MSEGVFHPKTIVEAANLGRGRRVALVDICTKRAPFYVRSRDAISKCRAEGGRLWSYTGSVQTLEYITRKELTRKHKQEGLTTTARQIAEQASKVLQKFTADKQWLASLASEGAVFSAKDPEDEQLIRALDRFEQGTIKLLTRDEPLLEAYPEKTITPTDFCQLPTEERKLQFIDLKTQQDIIRQQLEKNIHRVLHHGKYIMGPEVYELEEKLAQYVGVKHCISVSSGTDALLVAMMALGIKPGDEVITTPLHLYRYGGDDCADRCQTSVRGYRPQNIQPRPWQDRGRDYRKDQGHNARVPVRSMC